MKGDVVWVVDSENYMTTRLFENREDAKEYLNGYEDFFVSKELLNAVLEHEEIFSDGSIIKVYNVPAANTLDGKADSFCLSLLPYKVN